MVCRKHKLADDVSAKIVDRAMLGIAAASRASCRNVQLRKNRTLHVT